MSQHTDEHADGNPGCGYNQDMVRRFYQASVENEQNRRHVDEASSTLEQLEHDASVELFNKQVELLRKRLANDPQFFQQAFISEGINAITWEFQQDELEEKFIRTLWDLLLRNDLRAGLERLACPSQWLFGSRDTLVPAALQTQLRAYLPDADIEQIAGAGHAPFLSHPYASLDALMRTAGAI